MAKKTQPWRRLGRVHWVAQVADYETSGESQLAFAARRGLNLGTLCSWIYRLRGESKSGGAAITVPGRFVKVVAAGNSTRRSGSCILVHGNTEIRFAELPDALYLAELLRAIDA